MQNEIFQKETFFGIKNLLDKFDVDTVNRPILIIIPNIKTFPAGVLNDLIHHLKIYRGAPHFLNLNLMLGVQNNNREEIHLRVSIQNCVKLVIKTFYFPSMKNIIFEVVYKMLLSTDSILVFEPSVIASLVQTINLYGMSVDKFRRMLKVLIAEHIYHNLDLYYLHNIPFKLCSKKEFNSKYKGLILEQLQKDPIFVDWTSYEKQKHSEVVIKQTYDQIIKRRHWFKAFELIQELVCKAHQTIEKHDYRESLFAKIINNDGTKLDAKNKEFNLKQEEL